MSDDRQIDDWVVKDKMDDIIALEKGWVPT